MELRLFYLCEWSGKTERVWGQQADEPRQRVIELKSERNSGWKSKKKRKRAREKKEKSNFSVDFYWAFFRSARKTSSLLLFGKSFVYESKLCSWYGSLLLVWHSVILDKSTDINFTQCKRKQRSRSIVNEWLWLGVTCATIPSSENVVCCFRTLLVFVGFFHGMWTTIIDMPWCLSKHYMHYTGITVIWGAWGKKNLHEQRPISSDRRIRVMCMSKNIAVTSINEFPECFTSKYSKLQYAKLCIRSIFSHFVRFRVSSATFFITFSSTHWTLPAIPLPSSMFFRTIWRHSWRGNKNAKCSWIVCAELSKSAYKLSCSTKFDIFYELTRRHPRRHFHRQSIQRNLSTRTHFIQ